MRLTPLARRLGTAALVLTLGHGRHRLQRRLRLGRLELGHRRARPTAATDDSADERSPTTADAASGDAPGRALGRRTSTPSVMAAMREAETFTFETVTDVRRADPGR